jgi:hypothetical protein
MHTFEKLNKGKPNTENIGGLNLAPATLMAVQVTKVQL